MSYYNIITTSKTVITFLVATFNNAVLLHFFLILGWLSYDDMYVNEGRRMRQRDCHGLIFKDSFSCGSLLVAWFL